jgi:membrane protein implicated in regulation of membrane protease activity
MQVEVWVLWMVLAAVLMIGEILTAGFFLCWFSIGAAVAGVLALLGFAITWQIVAFIVVSLGLFAASRPFAEKLSGRQQMGIGANIIVGVIGGLIGGFALNLLGGYGITGFNFWSLIVATIGAVILLLIVNAFRHGEKREKTH